MSCEPVAAPSIVTAVNALEGEKVFDPVHVLLEPKILPPVAEGTQFVPLYCNTCPLVGEPDILIPRIPFTVVAPALVSATSPVSDFAEGSPLACPTSNCPPVNVDDVTADEPSPNKIPCAVSELAFVPPFATGTMPVREMTGVSLGLVTERGEFAETS